MANCIADSRLGCAADTYLYSLARHAEIFATIGSDDNLRLFDKSLNLLKAQRAHTGINCLSSHGQGFATAGRDGIVRLWDPRGQRSNTQIVEPRNRGFSSLACYDNFVAVGTENNKEGAGDVSVHLYDMRNAAKPVRDYTESHTDTITQLAFHPTRPELLLSGSTDGLVSIFDINNEDEDDALQRVFNPRSAVHCAGFLSPHDVYIATTDEHFSVHPLSEDAECFTIDLGDVRETLNCMYIVEMLSGESATALVCGHNLNQTLSVVELDRSCNFGANIDLPGAHGEEVVRDLMLFHADKLAYSCGEDGRVRIWQLPFG